MGALLKAIITTGGAAFLGQLLSLVTNKIFAQTLGPSGLGFYGLTRQLHDAAVSVAALGSYGLVQGLAGRSKVARVRLLRAAVLLSLAGIGVACIVLVMGAESIAAFLYGHAGYSETFAVTVSSFGVVLAVLAAIVLATINAMRAIKTLSVLTVVSSLAMALLALPMGLIAVGNLHYLVFFIAIPLALQFVVGLLVLMRNWKDFFGAEQSTPGGSEFRYLLGFMGFHVATMMVGTGTLLFVRASIADSEGLLGVGIFSAAWSIANQSMTLILASFAAYVLPTIAGGTPSERIVFLRNLTTLVVALTLPPLTILLVLKPLFIRLLFSADFLPAVDLYQWLMVGNFLKGLAWVLAVPALAAAHLKRFFWMEMAWNVLFGAGTAVALQMGDWKFGIGVAFVVAYAAYLTIAAVQARRYFGFLIPMRCAVVFGAGLLLLCIAMVATWGETKVVWPLAIACSAVAFGLSYFGVEPAYRRAGWALLASIWKRRSFHSQPH